MKTKTAPAPKPPVDLGALASRLEFTAHALDLELIEAARSGDPIGLERRFNIGGQLHAIVQDLRRAGGAA